MNYKVYVISLERRKDRRDKIEKEFKKHNIEFEFYNAIDGDTIQISPSLEKLFDGNEYDSWGIVKNNLYAANLTHLKLIKECSTQSKPFFIFEDDTNIIKNIDFSFDEIASKKLDAFWLVRNEPSILAYVVWPDGARKMHDWVFNTSKLDRGLDWKFLELRNSKLFNIEEISDDYFYQIPGYDSDIAPNGYSYINNKQ